MRGLFLGIVLDRDILFGRVELDILRNAVGSIQMGVEDLEASNGDSRRAVSAIRNFYSGVLLLMKERLRRQSPELIYTDLRPTINSLYQPTTLASTDLGAKAALA